MEPWTPLFRYGASYHLPSMTSNFDETGLEILLQWVCGEDQLSLSDLFSEPSTTLQTEASGTASAPPDFRLQCRVCSRSPSLFSRYAPSKIFDLQRLQPQPLPAHFSASAPLVMPSHPPITAEVAVPVIPPHQSLPADVVPSHPDLPFQILPAHCLHTAVAPHVSTPRMPLHSHVITPPQHQPPAYPYLRTDQSDACHNAKCSTDCQSHHPHHNLSLSGVEANDKNMLTAILEVPTSPTGCIVSSSASLAYAQHSPFNMVTDSESAAMEMSSMSAPVTPGTSNTSMYWDSTVPQRASLSSPPSPAPFIYHNEREATNEKIRNSTHCEYTRAVALKVETNLLNLNDGYTWKKYGEKVIKKHKYTRSYFRCDKKEQCKCKVVKRVQKLSNEEGYILFTYEGMHNHHP